jgi:hypothetical protein
MRDGIDIAGLSSSASDFYLRHLISIPDRDTDYADSILQIIQANGEVPIKLCYGRFFSHSF